MKKTIIAVLAIVAALAVGYYFTFVRPATVDIESVKNSNVPTSPLVGAIFTGMQADPSATIGSGIAKLAGVDGTAEWKSFRPEKYNGNSDIRCVQVVIKRPFNKGLEQIATFQFLFNRSSKFVELSYFDVHGTPKNMLEAIVALQYGVMEEYDQNTTAPESAVRLNQKFSQTEIQYLKKFGWNGVDVKYPDDRYFKILKSRLSNEMGTNYDVLLDNISVYSSRVKGSELVIRGNAPHQGGYEEGIIVINLNDGNTSVGLLHAKKYILFANNVGIVPQIVNDWASGKDIGD